MADFAFVQLASGSRTTLGNNTHTVDFSSALTTGNTLVAFVSYVDYVGGQTISSITGNTAPSWTEETRVGQSDWLYVHSLYTENITGGSTEQFTVTLSAQVDRLRILVAEYSGLAKSSSRLAWAGQNQISATGSITSGLLGTLSSAPAAIIAFASSNSDAAAAADTGAGFTSRGTFHDFGSGNRSTFEDRRVTATTSVAGTFTSATGDYIAVAFALKEASPLVNLAAHHYRMLREA